MAITTDFVYTNGSASAHKTLQLVDLGVANYSTPTTLKNGGLVEYQNNTDGSSFRSEIIKYFSSTQKGLPESSLKMEHPTKSSSRAVYGVIAEGQALTTSSDDPTYEVDNACTCKIVLTNSLDRNITSAMMLQTLTRAVSALFDDQGNFRGADLMQGALNVKDF
jgi:hypothetical protein